ncbi:hypothetical protein CYMTET_49649, partial [Cymbomonas tetramitiformis]
MQSFQQVLFQEKYAAIVCDLPVPARRGPLAKGTKPCGARKSALSCLWRSASPFRSGRQPEKLLQASRRSDLACGNDNAQSITPEFQGVSLIDISSLVSAASSAEREECISQIRQACEHLGFFHVTGHGVEEHLIQEFQTATRQFFSLEKDEKNFVKRNADNSRGYFDDELTKQKLDWKEAFDFGAQDGSLDGRSDVDGFNQWPANPPQFRTVQTAYFKEMEKLSERLLQ